MAAHFATIGHSNRRLADFLDMLQQARIDLLIDVRSFPRSRSNPVYNADRLPDDLGRIQIGYRHCLALGGRRPKQSGVNEQLNAMWRVQSFHNYADYALGDDFGAALDALVMLGKEQRLALMCSEAVWWRCHRRIIADYLLLAGHEVDHLMGLGRIDHAKPTPGAQITGQRKVIYPGPTRL